MDIGLIEGFVNKNVLVPGASLTVNRPCRGLGGITQGEVKETVSLSIIKRESKIVKFMCISSVDGRPLQVKPDQVLTIDGMDPLKLASVYGMKKDGSNKTLGKKRGRKPKTLSIT